MSATQNELPQKKYSPNVFQICLEIFSVFVVIFCIKSFFDSNYFKTIGLDKQDSLSVIINLQKDKLSALDITMVEPSGKEVINNVHSIQVSSSQCENDYYVESGLGPFTAILDEQNSWGVYTDDSSLIDKLSANEVEAQFASALNQLIENCTNAIEERNKPKVKSEFSCQRYSRDPKEHTHGCD